MIASEPVEAPREGSLCIRSQVKPSSHTCSHATSAGRKSNTVRMRNAAVTQRKQLARTKAVPAVAANQGRSRKEADVWGARHMRRVLEPADSEQK